MKGKRYTTEEKIRMLREADGGRSVTEICQEKNISAVTFYRWTRGRPQPACRDEQS
jgi:transposase-like protein